LRHNGLVPGPGPEMERTRHPLKDIRVAEAFLGWSSSTKSKETESMIIESSRKKKPRVGWLAACLRKERLKPEPCPSEETPSRLGVGPDRRISRSCEEESEKAGGFDEAA
jgi:hypothetical protein